ncbi:MAG: glutamine-hydrolyzing carbamoyl-phosphate synthase small subunit [Elusimicrobia bacterium]|nr:glutamine-hydrolyzing carbamoyl-phosphate synthase small subunit [Elusimicrobiota bacterium]
MRKEGKKSVLILADGTVFFGKSFGFGGKAAGEVVFNTALTGYEEILTDPSYCGQMVVMCYPHIGNYGINFSDSQSYKVWVSALIVREYSRIYSNWRGKISLGQFLKKNKVVGIEGVDTRAIVRKIREKGSMMAIVSTEIDLPTLKRQLKKTPTIVGRDLVSAVNGSSKAVFRNYVFRRRRNSPLVIVVDFGVKMNIIRHLEKRGLNVAVLGGKSDISDLIRFKPDGVVLSNGPGDPAAVEYGIKLARDLFALNLNERLPVLGICLGHQIMSLAAGAKIFKLKFGHHGGNHPVKNLADGKVEITSQNHNFCVDPLSLPENFSVTHTNLNDGTIEGIRHKVFPVRGVQFHPEAGPGPSDGESVFDEFAAAVFRNR